MIDYKATYYNILKIISIYLSYSFTDCWCVRIKRGEEIKGTRTQHPNRTFTCKTRGKYKLYIVKIQLNIKGIKCRSLNDNSYQ